MSECEHRKAWFEGRRSWFSLLRNLGYNQATLLSTKTPRQHSFIFIMATLNSTPGFVVMGEPLGEIEVPDPDYLSASKHSSSALKYVSAGIY